MDVILGPQLRGVVIAPSKNTVFLVYYVHVATTHRNLVNAIIEYCF